MHLLDTSALTLHKFEGYSIPEYAILSHRGRQEVSFRNMKDGKSLGMSRFEKIKGCCAQAKKDGWQFAWIDSCCIDKPSSADLSAVLKITSRIVIYAQHRIDFYCLSYQ
jgi:hypothetical protein